MLEHELHAHLKICRTFNMFANRFTVVLAVLAISLCGLSHAQVIQRGPCPDNVQVIANFDISRYVGTWYEHSKYPNIFELGGKCITAKYTAQSDGTVKVVNTQIGIFSGATTDIEGTAKEVENAKLLVVFPVSPPPKTSNYWVLDTDYTNYSTVYSCQPFLGLQRIIFVWILTRDPQPSPEIISKAENALTRNGISLNFLSQTDQKHCF